MDRHTERHQGVEMRVEWTTDLAEIRALRQPWLQLQERVQKRTVYCDHDWIVSWYESYCGTKYTGYGQALVGAAWQNGELVGVAPMITVRSRIARIPVREVLFAGFNLQAGELLMLDARPDIASEILRSGVRRGRWDVMTLTALQPEWEEFRLLRATAEELGLCSETTADDPYAAADLSDGYQPYIMKRSGHFRQNLKRYGRKIAAAGGWKLDRMSLTAGPEEVEGYVRRILAVAELGWRARQHGLTEERNHHPFFERVARAFGRRGMLDVTILTVGGKDAAYCVGLLERRRYYHVVMGFVEDLRDLSPSAFMLQEILKRLAEQGLSGVLSHGNYEYKRHWASEWVPQTRLLIFGRGWRSRLSHFAKFSLQPGVARLRSWVRRPDAAGTAPGDSSGRED